MVDIKFRTDQETKKRLKWGLKCQPEMKSYNKIIQDALNTWLDDNEATFGPPQEEDRPKPLPRGASRAIPPKKGRQALG